MCITRHTPERVADWRENHSRGAPGATRPDGVGDWRKNHGGPIRHPEPGQQQKIGFYGLFVTK